MLGLREGLTAAKELVVALSLRDRYQTSKDCTTPHGRLLFLSSRDRERSMRVEILHTTLSLSFFLLWIVISHVSVRPHLR